MAIDSTLKRNSAVLPMMPFFNHNVVSGEITQNNRVAIALLYAGILPIVRTWKRLTNVIRTFNAITLLQLQFCRLTKITTEINKTTLLQTLYKRKTDLKKSFERTTEL